MQARCGGWLQNPLRNALKYIECAGVVGLRWTSKIGQEG